MNHTLLKKAPIPIPKKEPCNLIETRRIMGVNIVTKVPSCGSEYRLVQRCIGRRSERESRAWPTVRLVSLWLLSSSWYSVGPLWLGLFCLPVKEFYGTRYQSGLLFLNFMWGVVFHCRRSFPFSLSHILPKLIFPSTMVTKVTMVTMVSFNRILRVLTVPYRNRTIYTLYGL